MDNVLLSIARDAVQSHFDSHQIDKESLLRQYPELKEKGACFVTLTQNEELRGCIGSLVANKSLLEDIIHNAKAAAFKDPRFMPLAEEELDRTRIELSLLSPPQLLEYSDVKDLAQKIRPGIDGVILRRKDHQATFLPQVWDKLNEFKLFFYYLCQKAGLGRGCLQSHPEIYTYQVEKVKES